MLNADHTAASFPKDYIDYSKGYSHCQDIKYTKTDPKGQASSVKMARHRKTRFAVAISFGSAIMRTKNSKTDAGGVSYEYI